MNMGKKISNGKMDKETIKHTIKTKYLNSYKVIVAGGRDYIYNYKAAIRKRAKDLTTFDAAINRLCNVIG